MSGDRCSAVFDLWGDLPCEDFYAHAEPHHAKWFTYELQWRTNGWAKGPVIGSSVKLLRLADGVDISALGLPS